MTPQTAKEAQVDLSKYRDLIERLARMAKRLEAAAADEAKQVMA